MPTSSSLLTIAGTDPCGGAGIQVDLQVFRDFGFHGLSVVTAVLSQNTRGVQRVDPMPADAVAQQLKSVFEDLRPAGIKIGLLPSKEVVEAVAAALKELRQAGPCPVVFDPVLASSSEHNLVGPGCVEAMRTHLIPQVDLLTPNLNEAELLLGQRIQTLADFHAAASELLGLGCGAALLKAGHLPAQPSEASGIRDRFADPQGATSLRELPAIPDDVRGTGCQLSSAILASIAAPRPDDRAELIAAIERARAYLNNLLHTRRRNIGGGRPVIVRERPARA